MTVAMIAVVATVAILTVAVAAIGAAYGAKTSAETAADAAALAAAVGTYPPAARQGPVVAARHLATSNGALLKGCVCPIDNSLRARVVEVIVTVPVTLPIFGERSIEARARAEFDPAKWLGG